MTSTESPDQNEYEESFKRFKTLFIVGAACFCVGVTVVILGNRFQLYEVQRLGIIFSSFGIGWIILAISYLVYMKWCFIPGESENSPQQVVERNVGGEGSIVPRTLGRPHSSTKALEAPPPTQEKNLGRHSSLAGRSYGRSISLAPKLQRSSPSVNGFESRPLHSSRNFERRSYSLRYFRDFPYGRDSKRLTSSFKNFGSPTSVEQNMEKRIPFVTSNRTPLERNSDKLQFLQGKPENPLARTSDDFERTSFLQKNYKPVCSESRQYEIPSSKLRNSERSSALIKISEKQPSSTHGSEGQNIPEDGFEKPRAFGKISERQPSLVHNCEGQMISEQNFVRPSFLKHSEEQQCWKFDPKAAPVTNCQIRPTAFGNCSGGQMSLAKSFERQSIPENCKRQSISKKLSCSCPARNCEDSVPNGENVSILPSVQKDFQASQTCKIGLDTKHEGSSPPDYYEVVLSLHKGDK